MWTEERVGALKKLQAGGRLSAEQIARRIGGVTKNAVIGKLHRMGLAAGKPLTSAERSKRSRSGRLGVLAKNKVTQQAIKEAGSVDAWKAAKPDIVPDRPLPPEPVGVARVASVLELEDHHCRWPLADRRGRQGRLWLLRCPQDRRRLATLLRPSPGRWYCPSCSPSGASGKPSKAVPAIREGVMSLARSRNLPIPTREPDGQFTSMQQWINKATSWIGGQNALCVDAKDRICRNGGDFKRADEESAFPIRFYYGAGGETVAEQRKSIARARRTLKLNYPWRDY